MSSKSDSPEMQNYRFYKSYTIYMYIILFAELGKALE